MISRTDFENYLKTIDTSEFEAQQKKGNRIWNIIFYSVVAVIFALVTATVIILVERKASEQTQTAVLMATIMTTVVLGTITAGLRVYLTRRGLRKFDNEYRNKILEKLFEGYSYTYERNGVIDSQIFARSGFSELGTDYRGQDLLSVAIPNKDGTPSATRFNICDLEITETHTYRDRQGNIETETAILYKGAFGYVSFAERFKCALGLNASCGMRGEKRIELEDVKFNKAIRTFTDNELEARVILDPVMMQKFLKLNTYAAGLKLRLRSNEGFLSMRRNLFEARRQKGQTMAEAYGTLYDDAYLIILIIEEIRKNDKHFKI